MMDQKERQYLKAERARIEEAIRREEALLRAAKEDRNERAQSDSENRLQGLKDELRSWSSKL